MRILVVADEECKYYYDYYQPGRLKEFDLILSCGDLKSEYLSFLVTMGRAPVLYVHGNHDLHYENRPPEGCISVEDTIYKYGDLRILGLGGCRRYHPGPHQYTDKEMSARIRKLWWKLKKHKGVDLVVTHAPPLGIGDGEDYAHRGFESFLKLMDKYRPKYLCHGHTHINYSLDKTRQRTYQDTQVINVYERYTLEIPDEKE